MRENVEFLINITGSLFYFVEPEVSLFVKQLLRVKSFEII